MTLSGQVQSGTSRSLNPVQQSYRSLFTASANDGSVRRHKTRTSCHMETDVVGDDGGLRSANYRTGQVSEYCAILRFFVTVRDRENHRSPGNRDALRIENLGEY